MDGFLIVDKPENMTSQTVCTKIKRKYKTSKCGHNGTLDPMTTGVMVVALGKATKLLNYLDNDDKIYLTTIIFGYNSDTLDIYGKITENVKMEVEEEKLDLALGKLKETTTQVPPIVSAIKVDGKKLLDYARKGEEVILKERQSKIYELKKVSDLRFIDDHYEIDLYLKVSKGFYVRSFARDLGNLLGGCAIMKKLRRLSSGGFNENNSLTLEKILEFAVEPLKIEEVFKYQIIEANERIIKYITNGVTIYPFNLIEDCNLKDITRLERFYFAYQGKLLAIYEKKGENYRPFFKF